MPVDVLLRLSVVSDATHVSPSQRIPDVLVTGSCRRTGREQATLEADMGFPHVCPVHLPACDGRVAT